MTSITTSKRLEQIKDHISGCSSSREHLIHQRHPDDIVIVAAVRTPICKANKGAFRDLYPEDMLAVVLKAAAERAHINTDVVNDIQTGNVLQELGGIKVGRAAMFCAGYPYTTSYMTLNRQCASGLQACSNIAKSILAGEIDVGIGAGVESMSNDYGTRSMPSRISKMIGGGPGAAECFMPMGITSDNVAQEFSISREAQDQFSAESHEKALRAQALGLFDAEIVPVHVQQTVSVKDEKTGEVKDVIRSIIVTKDEGPRPGTTVEKLAKLKPVFRKDGTGTTTAGSASQVSDGAAAVVMMRRSKAEELGCKVLARWVCSRIVGVPPRIMGIGPAVAIPAVLKAACLRVEDVDVFEINEAFASQALYCVRKLGIDPAKVNPKGGAIALGHPLGMTGARQIATLLPQLKQADKTIGVVSMCMGAGMGMAAVIVSEQEEN
ncbi:3-ketoacyl-CoA thiolase, peroxisomal [Lunasporangiospora selenospora]|uniref:acetyl-CoA C-acyltransferase n=1 Tax=Lunasporangiospora selenospora TaxID=979761 RepID=A0A9P6FUB3_9FUNG|nr:3-ketoacyl-CoA thiolase, peroxisomal [Lunasporangiospora selenospora]